MRTRRRSPSHHPLPPKHFPMPHNHHRLPPCRICLHEKRPRRSTFCREFAEDQPRADCPSNFLWFFSLTDQADLSFFHTAVLKLERWRTSQIGCPGCLAGGFQCTHSQQVCMLLFRPQSCLGSRGRISICRVVLLGKRGASSQSLINSRECAWR